MPQKRKGILSCPLWKSSSKQRLINTVHLSIEPPRSRLKSPFVADATQDPPDPVRLFATGLKEAKHHVQREHQQVGSAEPVDFEQEVIRYRSAYVDRSLAPCFDDQASTCDRVRVLG